MAKKYVLAGAIAAGMMAAASVGAPVNLEKFPLAKAMPIVVENALEKSVKEWEKKRIEIETLMHKRERYETDVFDESSYTSNEDALVRLTARLMMGEDEDNPDICKIADAWTVINRLDRGYGSRFAEVALTDWWYSCFNEGSDSNIFLKIPLQHNEGDFLKNLQLARDFWSGKYPDPTHGATNYFNPDLVPQPDWVPKMIYLGKIGKHKYYKEKSI